MRRILALALLASTCAYAQEKAVPLPPPKPGYTVLPDEVLGANEIEPRIERLVQEDRNARVDELRVRGEVKKVTVHSKIVPVPDYEILVGDASREPVAGPNGLHGVIGQRVWELIEF